MLRTHRCVALFGLAAIVAALLGSPASSWAATAAAGDSHTLVVRTTDNTVWAWGLNSDGQLGDDTTTQRETPIQVLNLSGIVAVAAGARHSLALTSAGVLWVWGDNEYGQIGNGDNTDQVLPVQVATGVTRIAAGDYHSIALKADGTVWIWGRNSNGQLGDGGTANRNTPVQVTGLGLVTGVGGGANHTLVVLSGSGLMKSWGENANGQLGDGSLNQATNPVAVTGVSNATDSTGGGTFSIARRDDATLYVWGGNADGELGLGDTSQRPTPTLLAGLGGVTSVATGGSHALALLSDGTVVGWGHNAYGSVGDGSGLERTTPVALAGLSSVSTIAAGQYHSVAITSTGEVWAWGSNNAYQLGDGTTTNRLSPVKIADAGFAWKVATPMFSVAPGTYGADQSVSIACVTSGATIRYTTDGTDPTTSSPAYASAIPVTVSTTLKAQSFKTGLAGSNLNTGVYTLQAAAPAFSPAGGTYGAPQAVSLSTATTGATIRYTVDGSDPVATSPAYSTTLDVATTTSLSAAAFKSGWTTSPVTQATYAMNFGTLATPVFSPPGQTYVDAVTVTLTPSAGATVRYTVNASDPDLTSALYTGPLSLSTSSTLKAKAWQTDYTPSAVGVETYVVKSAPPVLSRPGGAYTSGTTVTVTAATAGSTLHLTTSGIDPTETDPVIVSGGSLLVADYTLRVRAFKPGCEPSDTVGATYSIAAGAMSGGTAFSLGLSPAGNVYAWGANGSKQLGDGTTTTRPLPSAISSPSNVIAIAAGAAHALAVSADGGVWSWGANESGQLGDGTQTGRGVPARLTGLADVVAVGARGSVSAALTADGTLWMWGANADGQLGLGDTVLKTTPRQVVTGVAEVAVGGRHTLARKSNGSLWAWGYNANGQLGDGSDTSRSLPVPVGLGPVMRIAAGDLHSLALTVDGAVWSWGNNSWGQLGDPALVAKKTSPGRVPGLLSLRGLAAGGDFSVVSKADGSVWVWGRNDSGQLGDGTVTTSGRSSPVRLASLGDIASVTAGARHGFATAANRAVWVWGANSSSQLGDGTARDRLTPVSLADVSYSWRAGTPVLDRLPGYYTAPFTLALTTASSGGTIHYTLDGSEPDAASSVYTAPLAVGESMVVRARTTVAQQPESNIDGGAFELAVVTPSFSPGGGTYTSPQTVAISTTTPAATIRYTTNGQVPDETSPVYSGPVSIGGQTYLFARAFKSGWTNSGLRVGTYSFNLGALAPPVFTPTGGTYPGPLGVTISASGAATIRYTTDGTAPTTSSPAYSGPLTLTENKTIKATAFHPDWAASGVASAAYSVKLATPILSVATGSYAVGQAVTVSSPDAGMIIRYTLDGMDPVASSTTLTSGTTLHLMRSLTLKAAAFKTNCVQSDVVTGTFSVSGSVPEALLAGGDAHSLAVIADGSLWAWGDNSVGRLGDGTYTERLVPTRVTWSGTATRLAAGSTHGLATDSGGALKGWGNNGWGELGDGSTTSRTPAVLTSGLPPGTIASIAGGRDHSLASLTDGTVVAWGYNASGQLGDGSTNWHPTPAPVPGLTDVVRVSAAGNQSFAVKADGGVLAWGQNGNGQLGDGSRTQRLSPVPITGLASAIAIAAGGSHTLALTSSGVVYAWGWNGYGQLGNGTQADSLSPTQVPGLTGVVAIAAGSSHSLALRADGSVWSWGANYYGQVGDGTNNLSMSPKLVGEVRQVVAIGAGLNHSLALSQDGVVWVWGHNASGQLGDGSKVNRLSPVATSAGGGTWNVAQPIFSYASGTYTFEFDVVVSDATPGTTIRYTLTGADPTPADPSVASGGSIHVGSGAALKARAFLASQQSAVSTATYVLSLNAPSYSPWGGTFGTDVDATLSALSGATIRYTTDGSDPTDTSTVYTGPVHISQPVVLKARAYRAGWAASAVGAQTYAMKVAVPTLTPNGGTFTAATSVAVSTTTPSAVVRYTLDGREPSPSSTAVSAGHVAVSGSTTLRARAWRAGWTPSDGAGATYSMTIGQAGAPTMDPPAGTYAEAQTVTLNAAPGAIVRYTFDDTAPSWNSPRYSRPIAVGETTTLKAKAWLADSLESPVATADYTIDLGQALAPRFSVTEGRYATRRLVTVTCPTPGSAVHYTTTGAEPTTNDTMIDCGATITLSRSAVLKARAWKDGLSPSAVRQAVFEITGMVAAGALHSLALDADGRAWVWGYNGNGQLGDGTYGSRLVPYRLPGFGTSPVAFISAGNTHSLAATEDGRVWVWGSNETGQLGDGTTTPRVSPVQIPAFSVSPVVAVSAGQAHSLALTADGRVWGWGWNGYGQVGDGTGTGVRTSPVQLAAFSTAPVTGIAAGALHSLAISGDGFAWAWGINYTGELGDGTLTPRPAPVRVASLARVVQIAAGSHGGHSLALTFDDSVWAWGGNSVGQLGDGTLSNRNFPVRVSGLNKPVGVTAGNTNSVASTLDGSGVGMLVSWGSNGSGLLGDASTASSRAQPGRVTGLASAFSASSSDHLLAIDLAGGVWAWGPNNGGQLGTGTASPSSIPVRVTGLTLSDNSFLTSDPDGDGLVTGIELRLGTDPFALDTNGDGIDDGTALKLGQSAADPDVDHDGLANTTEMALGTDPFNPDTDGDGVSDGLDAFALDGTRSTAPPDSADHTPPSVSLTRPAEAQIVP